MNTVSYRKYRKAFRDLQRQVYELYVEDKKNNPNTNIPYIGIPDVCKDEDMVELSINWSCCGSVSIATANLYLFVKRFNKVIELVNNFPYNGYKLIYGED